MTGAQLIAAERKRQIVSEGWTPDHDAEHFDGSLALVAVCYIKQGLEGSFGGIPNEWPASWSLNWWKPNNDPIRNLVKAGALIAAEIDRLQREEKH